VDSNDVFQTVQALECVQIDPVAVVERNQHLVLYARMPEYQPTFLEQLLRERRVFEYFANAACVIPRQDYPIFEVVRRRISERIQPELDRLGTVAEDVLKRLEAEGPLPAKAFTSAERVHGYWDNTHPKTKATSHALNLLHDMGRIHVVDREGTTRFFDIRERAVPKDLLDEASSIHEHEAMEELLKKYLRAYRVFDAGDPRFGWQRMTAAERRQAVNRLVEQGMVVPLHIEEVKRPYYILAEDVDRLMHHAADTSHDASAQFDHVQFLPPLDNLLWRREHIEDLFDFSYTWEVYIPAAKRRFGYYAMPILVGDRLIGRVDPRLDRDRAQLNIQLLQIEQDVRWTKTLRRKVLDALEDFARFHQATLHDIERTEPEGVTV
jgi:uncharacterized protein